MRRLPIACLGSIALALCLPAGAGAELKAIWGPNKLPDGRSAFPTYRKLGVDVLERQLQWNDVAARRPRHPRNPNDPAYHWPADVDGAATGARRHHLRLALEIKGTPAWANGGKGPQWAPTHANDVARFAVAAARHYRRVHLWMVWGEPSLPGNFEPWPAKPNQMDRRYAQVVDATYGALKSVRRSNIVIGGSTWDGGPQPPLKQFLRWFRLPNGNPPRLDWWAHDPYGVRYPRLSRGTYSSFVRDMSDVDTYVKEIRHVYRRIHRRPKLWLAEFNVQSDRPSRAFSFYVSRKAQARWLTAAYRIAHREHYIAGLGWFELLDGSGARRDRPLSGGLMSANGRRKPAWYAYRRAR